MLNAINNAGIPILHPYIPHNIIAATISPIGISPPYCIFILLLSWLSLLALFVQRPVERLRYLPL